MTPHSPIKVREFVTTGLGAAALAGAGGLLASLAGLPAGATAALCGLPLVVAAVVADRRLGIASMSAYGAACAVALAADLAEPASIASSAFVMTAILATLGLAAVRRQRHERTVVGLERLNHQILGDSNRRVESPAVTIRPKPAEAMPETNAALTGLHEAGRRIATHSDLETLVPVIITEARSLLKCNHAEIYFWNGSSRELSRPFPERARDVGRYEPDSSTGAAAWVLATHQLYLASAADRNRDFAAATFGDRRRPAAIVPLIAGNDLTGLLVVDELEGDAEATPMVLWNLANLAALGLRNAILMERVADAARRHPQTGLLDEGGFAIAVERRLARLPRESAATILSGDLDRFGQLNGEHGFRTGDDVLREVARLWKAMLPHDAVIGQVEGDGFVAFLPDSDHAQAERLAADLREAIEAHPFVDNAETLCVTCRFGVASFRRNERTLDDALRLATDALTRAKANGGNQVCSASPEVVGQR